jgi:golgi apyrase
VATFANNPSAVGPDHLQPLLDHALKHIPKKYHSETPLFLLATAGMRLLNENDREQILSEICEYTRVNSPFQVPECDLHIQVIPGETEGLYGWIAANYLLGGFNNPEEHDHGKGHHTYGFLDMGGASAQIAFAPNVTETEKHAEDLKLLRLRKVNGEDDEYRVFVTTWLGFGANQARARYIEALVNSTYDNILELPDPCLPSGLRLSTTGQAITPETALDQHLLGTGDFPQCLLQTYPLLEKDKPCNDDPCLLGGVHVPAIDFDVNHFVGVSEYWHTTHEVFEMAYKDKAYDFHTYQARVNEFCSQDWNDIASGVKAHKWGKKVDEIIAEEVCFKASWLINMLHEGIGIPRIGVEPVANGKNVTKELVKGAKSKGFLDPFQAVDKIEDVEVSWTLGKMVLYASSQVPPASEPFPVGFGSNIPGIAVPMDFQRPGGLELQETDAGDWTDSLFSDSPRRVPGLLLFLLIVCVAVYFLCGRERRVALFGRVSRCCCGRRGRAPGSPGLRLGKLFGRSAYARVNSHDAEAGAGGLELPTYDSDDDAGDVEVQASGWATPTVKGVPGGVEGSLLRDGLVRADSRDRLVPSRFERLNRSRSPAVKGKVGVD